MDNYALDWASKFCDKQYLKEIIPVFSFDPRFYATNVEQYGSRKCGVLRARFI